LSCASQFKKRCPPPLEAIIGALYACFGNINDKLSTIHDANLLDLIHVLSLNEIAIPFTYTKQSSRTGHA
jgi:hypothetical protein